MTAPDLQLRIRDWSRRFAGREMTVEDVQEAFASLRDEEIERLAPELRSALNQARQELDAIRFGMCEAGQAGEVSRIFQELDSVLAKAP
jgi:hypothetical protein